MAHKWEAPENSKAVLVDITKCIGCDACSVACKMWNDIEFRDVDFNENKSFHKTEREKIKLDGYNWTSISLHKVEKEDKTVWRYAKHQCLHCDMPACAAACFATALKKDPNGPVIFYPNLCVGCRYCFLACPFDKIKYEWDKSFPFIAKCHMCPTRIAEGQAPACVSVCPTNVMTFGDKDEMLALARKTIESDDKYVKHIYGEKEAGGTSWLYISDVPFEELGFNTEVKDRPMPEYSYDFQKYAKYAVVGWGTMLTAFYLYTKRRNEVAKEEKNKS